VKLAIDIIVSSGLSMYRYSAEIRVYNKQLRDVKLAIDIIVSSGLSMYRYSPYYIDKPYIASYSSTRSHGIWKLYMRRLHHVPDDGRITLTPRPNRFGSNVEKVWRNL